MALCPAKIFVIWENGKIDTVEIISHLCFIRDIFSGYCPNSAKYSEVAEVSGG